MRDFVVKELLMKDRVSMGVVILCLYLLCEEKKMLKNRFSNYTKGTSYAKVMLDFMTGTQKKRYCKINLLSSSSPNK